MPTSTPARLFKACVSLLVLAAAIAGLPLLLAWATPVIWATTHDDLAHLLDRQDTGSAFLLILVTVGWIGWAQFTFCCLRELAAQLRGRHWHAPRGLGASQRAAALLVGSILVLLPANSALASDAHAATTTTATRSPGHSTGHPATATRDAAPQNRAQATSLDEGRVYTVREVRPAESLWSIAERELGDGERWREIAALNAGHTMAGGTTFRTDSFLQPGWQLRMPAEPASETNAPRQAGRAHAHRHSESGRHPVGDRRQGNGRRREVPRDFQREQGRRTARRHHADGPR